MSSGARILAIGGHAPVIEPDAVVLAGATVVGDVRVGARSSVWYAAVLRADQGPVGIGTDSNVQDGAVLHADPGYPATIGDRVTIGHAAVVHGATVEDDCIVGMGAVLLNGVHVGRGSIVAAGSVLAPGTRVSPGSLALGSPAKVRRDVRPDEVELIAKSWRDYVALARAHVGAPASH
ncbi:gamma carbonic anhydrase family protein [Rugosimonospora africana]|uniref:Gamma carbonic anhydrase family protein n=1 Tax=Rugosimonospora africana TaxID=556532 RepID=A0A8J3VUG4_9ACTN|nr:gamma carbonic anhydrase family protein [Rugosimonospora africana]GIH19255.1 gamma carbonic anhydrase family protein [Rugosimonospora africana]